jgi:hypothetical protein
VAQALGKLGRTFRRDKRQFPAICSGLVCAVLGPCGGGSEFLLIARPPSPFSQTLPGGLGQGMARAEAPNLISKERLKARYRPRRIAGLALPVSQIASGGQRFGRLRAKDA